MHLKAEFIGLRFQRFREQESKKTEVPGIATGSTGVELRMTQ